MEKKFLLRMSDERFRTLSILASTKSLNQYINDVLDAHINQMEGRRSQVEKIIIGDLKVSEVREAATVTLRKSYIEILKKYKISFFAASKTVTPMMYIYYYGDSSCSPARCISHVGKVSHIYRNVRVEDIQQLPEVKDLFDDPLYHEELMWWEKYPGFQVAILSELGELSNPIWLTEEYDSGTHPAIIVNRTTSIVKGFAATKMDDLFKKIKVDEETESEEN